MEKFKKDWVKVRELGKACVTDEELVRIIGLLEKKQNLTEQEEAYIEAADSKYKDPYGMYLIDQFIKKVDEYLEDSKFGSVIQEKMMFNLQYPKAFLEKILGGDTTCEEYQKRYAFLEALNEL